MSSDFAEFTQAVARAESQTRSPIDALDAPPLSRVAILGGGSDACLLAAICLANDAQVTLFSAYAAELNQLKNASGITLRGAGPVGTYQVDRENAISIKTTGELDSAIADAQLIFLTGPIHKQRTYAMVLSAHLKDDHIVVLAPGRSLGALETAWYLRIGGCTADVTVIETQGLPWWVQSRGTQLHLSECAPVSAASLPSNRPQAIEQLKRFLPNIRGVESVLSSGFADGSALVEFPALLLNGPAMGAGGMPVPMGGRALPENNTFRALIGDEHRTLIEQLAAERHAVAAAFGVRHLPDVEQWLQVHAGNERGEGSRPVPARAEARTLLRDGVIGSLVPLLSAAQLTAIPVPMTQSMVTLAATILGADVAAAGRRLDTIGIDGNDVDSARRAMDKIAMRHPQGVGDGR